MTSWGKLIKKGMRKLKKRMFKAALCLTLVFALSAAAVARIALSDAYKASAGVYSGYSVAVDRPRGTVFDRNLDPITNREEKYKAVLTATPEVTKELYRCFSAGEAEKIVESLRENKPIALYVPKDFRQAGRRYLKYTTKRSPTFQPFSLSVISISRSCTERPGLRRFSTHGLFAKRKARPPFRQTPRAARCLGKSGKERPF